MYAKVFSQIFDSSIAENYEARHVFQDLLILADRTGVVDMTVEAIARRTNGPAKRIKEAIQFLSQPDPRSRSKEHEGRRLIQLDSRRDWGWIIVNYEHYRSIQDEEARRATWRDAKAKQRQRQIPKRKHKKPSVQTTTIPTPEQIGYVIHTQQERGAVEKIHNADNPFNEEE